MDYQEWMEGIDGFASLYSFDILPDGSFSEIRLMAVNKQNEGMLHFRPDAPEFYPGIPYRNYWMDLNFERYLYKSGSERKSLYSYVNARGFWLKGFYIPIRSDPCEDGRKTVYSLYILEYSDDIETESMSQYSADVSSAVVNINIKLHEKEDFYQAMSAAAEEIKNFCGAERCSIYTVDKRSQKCRFINENGIQNDYLDHLADEMKLTPYEVALKWEEDLAMSDCLLLEELSVIEERDPVWYTSLKNHGIRNMILYVIRFKQELVGFIWAANFVTSKIIQIKEAMELTTFLIAAVISNHQLVSRLEEKSTTDALTQVSNRNSMNERVDKLSSGDIPLPEVMGIVFADLNGLKTVNDRMGHNAGDKLLVRAAALLKIAFGEYEIYRAGGDEFVVLCPDITEEKLEQQAAQLRALADNTNDVSFAVGTQFCTGSYDIQKAMQAADGAMYRDKQDYYRRHPEKDRRKEKR